MEVGGNPAEADSAIGSDADGSQVLFVRARWDRREIVLGERIDAFVERAWRLSREGIARGRCVENWDGERKLPHVPEKKCIGESCGAIGASKGIARNAGAAKRLVFARGARSVLRRDVSCDRGVESDGSAFARYRN